MTTIEAADLRQMIERVKPHMSDDDVLPIINCVRIEHSDGYLFAVATDRYTIAVARTPVVNTGETWNFSIPAHQIKAVTSWLKTIAGNVDVTSQRDADQIKTRISGIAGSVEFSTSANFSGTFPHWRGLVRTALTAEPAAVPVTSYTSRFLSRWEHGGEVLHSWQAAQDKPVLFMSDNGFIGLHMPVRARDVVDRADLAETWLHALVPTGEVDGITYRLDRQWSDKDGDVWEYTGRDRYSDPLMRVVGIEDDDHTLTDLVALYGPIEPVLDDTSTAAAR